MPEDEIATRVQVTPPTAGGRRRVVVAVALVVVAALIAAWALLGGDDDSAPEAAPEAAPEVATGPQAPAGSDVVTEFSGDGNGDTDEFQVDEGWEIRWETAGKNLEIAVTGEQDVGTVLRFTDGPAGGTTRPIGSGKLRLEITADGSWSVLIINHADDGS